MEEALITVHVTAGTISKRQQPNLNKVSLYFSIFFSGTSLGTFRHHLVYTFNEIMSWQTVHAWYFTMSLLCKAFIPPGTCSMKILKNPSSLTEPRYLTMFLWLSLMCSLISSCSGCTSLKKNILTLAYMSISCL